MSKHGEHVSRQAVATVVQRAVQGGGRGPLPGQREVDVRDRPRSRPHRVLGAPLGQPGRDRRGLQGGPHEQRARGARAPAQGGSGAALGARHPPAGHGFFRQGDPVNVYAFIEAERVARVGNVRRACVLLKVSRAAYYAWSTGALCERRLADEELLERIAAAHKASRGTYGSPRITRAPRAAGLPVGRKRLARRRGSSSTQIAAASTPPLSSAGCWRGTASCSRSPGPASAGITPWRRASSRPSRRSCSTAASGRRAPLLAGRSSSTSRCSTIASACTPPWATSRRWPTKQDGET